MRKMTWNLVSCFSVLILVTLAQELKHDELLARGYEYFPGVGYYYFGTNRNWTYALKDCTSSKGRLAVINSEEERQAIVTFLSKHTEDTYVYAGFTNQYETQFVTTEGIPLKHSGYTKWVTGQPSGNIDLCGGFNTSTGELIELRCNSELSYVCEHQLWTDYTFVKGIGYYKLHTEGKEWADAYDICESEGAHLLVIDTQAEADAVMEIYNEHPELPNADSDLYIFVGFRAVMAEMTAGSYTGTYLTIFGTSVSDLGYVKWHGYEPTVGDSSFCGALYRNETSYLMFICHRRFAFFCEKELQAFNRT